MIYRTVFQANLIDEYLDLVYNRYILTQPGILVDYYNIDVTNSVYDETLKSTYNRPGNIDLTGIKFKCFKHLLLQFGTKTQRQDSDSQNFGYNNYDTRFQIFLPALYKIEPNPNDFVVFKPNPKDEEKVFLVEGIERSTIGTQFNHVGYMLTLKPYYITRDKLDTNITETLVFDTFSMKMETPSTYDLHLTGFIIFDTLLKELRNRFNISLLQYVDNFGNTYQEFKSILYLIRQRFGSFYRDLNIPYSSYYNQEFMNKFQEFLQSYDISKLNLQNITISNDIKNLNSLTDILNYIQTNDVSQLNTLEIFVLLYKTYSLLKEVI